MTKSKIEINQLGIFCYRLNATVPYPKSKEENQYYRDAFDSMAIFTPVTIRSRYGFVELEPDLRLNLFPNEILENVVCEKVAAHQTARVKRQATSGIFIE